MQAQRFGGGATFVQDPPVDCCLAHDPAFADLCRTRLELWLDQCDDLAFWGEQPQRRRQHQRQTDEAGVDDCQAGADPPWQRFQVAHVGAVQHDDPRVGAQFPGQLAVADIDRIDAGCPPLQQAVGEATGAGPDIDGDQVVDSDRKRVECCGQLDSSAADVREGLPHCDGGSGVDQVSGFVRADTVDFDFTRHDQPLCLLSAGGQPAPMYQSIQSFFLHR